MLINLVFAMLMIFGSCQSKTQHLIRNGNQVIEKAEQHFDLFFKSPLDTIVCQYITDVDSHFISKEWLYYSMFFFEEDTSRFFTIWAFTVFPDYISECIDTDDFSYYFTKYLQRNIIVISKNDNELILPSKESINLAYIEKEKKYEGDNYSGQWFFETYRIIKEKDRYMIIRNDSIINNFLDCLQIKDDDVEIDED